MADAPKTLADKMAELSPERRAWVEAETERMRAEMAETEFLLRGNNRARLEASIANLDAGRVVSFDADPTSPWVLTKSGRIQDLTDEDLDGFEFLRVEHEPDDAAVVAKTIQDMNLEEKIALGRSMLEGVESNLDEEIEGGPFFGEDEEDDLPTPIASYDAYVLSHRFKDVMAECETGGNLHNLVSSANVEDDDVAYLTDKAETPAEKACIELAAQLSPGERWAAWLIANGREAEATRHGFDARNMPQMDASELRTFIDSLDNDA